MDQHWKLVSRPQGPAMKRVASEAGETLTVITPFVSREAATELLHALPSPRSVAVKFLTAGDPDAIISGACDPVALQMIAERSHDHVVYRLHGLHAKVYIADETRALVTSANLTGGGAWRNYEYGISITNPDVVSAVVRDVTSYLSIATPLTPSALAEIEKLLAATQQMRSGPTYEPMVAATRAIEDILVREHVSDKSEHEVFANSVLFVLRREGSLRTAEIHPHIEALHPQLCDGRDRVIDGRSFGKRWKHQVRNAQQYLKEKGLIDLSDGRWHLVESK
jgi:hypothetical protein